MIISQQFHTKTIAELQQLPTCDLQELHRQSFSRRWLEEPNPVIDALDRRYNRGQRDLQSKVKEILAQRSH